MIAPIVVFGFVRKESLEQVICSLQKNSLSAKSDLYIFIDGPRNVNDSILVEAVSNYCNTIAGFKTVNIYRNQKNKGLDPSVIDGVTQIINIYGRAIVLEDDVIVAPNFLEYMNQCLDVFEHDERIMSISGWSIDINIPKDYPFDAYLLGRSTSWGWATWKDRWNKIDWEIKDWNTFKNNRKQRIAFNRRGGSDMFPMLKKCMNGGGMWDIRFCYHMFKNNLYSVVPIVSKTANIGFNNLAVHCKPVKYLRYKTTLDNGRKTNLSIDTTIQPNKDIIKQRLKISSVKVRLITKLKNIFSL